MRKAIALLLTISILIGVSGCALGDLVSQAPTATPTPSRTPKPTFTPLVAETPTPEATPIATNTPVVVPTDTPAPAPSPTATPTATNTSVPPPPTPTSPPPPPTATPTHTPTPVVYACSYVEGSREKSAGGKPAEGTQPTLVVEGYILGAAGAGRNGLGVYFEHINLVDQCVVSGNPAQFWQPGQWKHEFWGVVGAKTKYYLTVMESCAPGARALSPKTEFSFSWWADAGHQFDIRFNCNL